MVHFGVTQASLVLCRYIRHRIWLYLTCIKSSSQCSPARSMAGGWQFIAISDFYTQCNSLLGLTRDNDRATLLCKHSSFHFFLLYIYIYIVIIKMSNA